MADTPKHSVSVAGIVVDDQDRVLVIQRRDNGQWEPPGGVLELGETPQEGVQREVFEETGVRVEVQNLSGVYKNMTRNVVSLVFRCSPVDGHVQSTNESREVRWISAEYAVRLMDSAYAVRVKDAFEDAVSVRSHDGVELLAKSP